MIWLIGNLLAPAFIAQIFGSSTSRYLTIATPAAALLLAVFATAPKSESWRRIGYLVVAGWIVMSAFWTRQLLVEHSQHHSVFARQFFKSLKQAVPSLPPSAFIYIKLEPNTVVVANRIGDIIRVGALKAESSIAIHYGLKNFEKIDLYTSNDQGAEVALQEAIASSRPVFHLNYEGESGTLQLAR